MTGMSEQIQPPLLTVTHIGVEDISDDELEACYAEVK